MGRAREKHRPLLSGIGIRSLTETGYLGVGTLTGLAIRHSDRKKMLVTCLHV